MSARTPAGFANNSPTTSTVVAVDLTNDSPTTSTAVAADLVLSPTVTAVSADASTVPIQPSKRKFPSLKEFAAFGEDRIKRKIIPVEKWETLEKQKLYLLKRLISMDVNIRGKKQVGWYVALEDSEGKPLHVWITDIMKGEIEKYDLSEDNVYIMPLGMKTSKESGYSYFDFIVQKYL